MAHAIVEKRLSVSGTFFLEVFAGDAVFTLVCVMHFVPGLRPWDITYGSKFDVIENERILSSLIVGGVILLCILERRVNR